MTTYVLVHGAWGGPHQFGKVRRLLQAAGHEVFTPCLTGIGERVHLTGPQVNLSTHVTDVVNSVLYEDLDDIVLVGYSYGGMVVTGTLDHIGDRVHDLVYLDAFVPADGQSARALQGAGRLTAPITIGADWLVSPAPRTYDDPADAEWLGPRRTPHPAACFTEAVRRARPIEDEAFSLTYIRAVQDDAAGGVFTAAGAHASDSPRWRYREVDTNHMIPTNRPQVLAELLLELPAA
ncbi:alpha/beta fold hydrolase [Cumulibacter soli]|uniref:alpha/beta fold hydrolase n=1 Tax=Cumulibacter soli TaxID=2546344 RepID=UPI00106773AD|nr:alpha/beta hydrolase [Cumulibacter soli]